MTRRCAVLGLGAAMLGGCSREEDHPASDSAAGPSDTSKPAGPKPALPDGRPVIVAFGDSLTAGFGVPAGRSYADYLQADLDRRGYKYRVVNQGISGDTTSGGLSRIGAAVSLRPEVVILEMGANDGLRGLPVEATRQNLEEMIDALHQSGAKVLLCGMTLPPNYGPDYIGSFEKVFRELSKQKGVALMPFFLEGVATNRDLMQPDGLHPNAEGSATVAQNVIRYLTPLLRR